MLLRKSGGKSGDWKRPREGRGAHRLRRRRRGVRDDRSGQVLADGAGDAGHDVVWRGVVADERAAIAGELAGCATTTWPISCSRPEARGSRRATSRPRPRSSARAPEPGRRPGAARRRARAVPARHALAGRLGHARRTFVVNLPGSPRAWPRGWRCSPPCSSTRSRCCGPSPASIPRRRADEHARDAGPTLLVAREDRAHGLRAAVRLRRGDPRSQRLAGPARDGLDHGRDGRRALVRDGREPADRRDDRRAQPAHRHTRAARRTARAARRSSCSRSASLAVFLVAVWQLDRSRTGCGRSWSCRC